MDVSGLVASLARGVVHNVLKGLNNSGISQDICVCIFKRGTSRV